MINSSSFLGSTTGLVFCWLLSSSCLNLDTTVAFQPLSSSGTTTTTKTTTTTTTTIARISSTDNNRASLSFRRSSLSSPSSSMGVPMALESTAADEGASSASKDGGNTMSNGDAILDQAPVEAGSHEELMYALGVNLARQLGDVRPLVETGDELAKVAQGLLDTVVGRLSEEGQQSLLGKRGQDLNELVQVRANAIKVRLEEAGKDMLENMKQTPGVKVLDSGVVLHVLEHGPDGPGQGVRPTRSSTVKIHYHGTLADGTIFDTTLTGGEPVSFPLGGVIPGWREGVLQMHEGETAMLGIPPNLAYGDAGTPDGRIPGGSTLFFKIQLLEVLSAVIGGSPNLVGSDGKKLSSKTTNNDNNDQTSSGLLGADGKPL